LPQEYREEGACILGASTRMGKKKKKFASENYAVVSLIGMTNGA